jgi:hypothetical protein
MTSTIPSKKCPLPLVLCLVTALVSLQACGPEDCRESHCAAASTSDPTVSSPPPQAPRPARSGIPIQDVTATNWEGESVDPLEEELPGPRIEFDVDQLELPATFVGRTSMTSFRVRNVSDEPVFFEQEGTQLRLAITGEGSAPGEFVAVPLGTYDPHAGLVPGNALEIGVFFVPTAVGARTGQLELRQAGSSLPLALLALTGEGVATGLCAWSVSQQVVDFGLIQRRESAALTLTLTNEGPPDGPGCELMTVSTVQQTHPAFKVEVHGELSEHLEPGATLELTVWFTGMDEPGEYEGALQVEVRNGEPGEARLPLRIVVVP